MSNIKISVVLGSYNRLQFLKKTIASVRLELAAIKESCEIVVVDGGSDDGTLSWLSEQKDILTIIQHNRGIWQGKEIDRKSWGYFMNLAFKSAKGTYICMISDDCLIVPGSIQNGLHQFETALKHRKKVGGIAFHFRNWGLEKEYYVQTTLGDKLFINHGLFLAKALQDVGYLDEDTYHFYHADGDVCLKLWAKGYEIVPADGSYIEHFPHANPKVRNTNSKKKNSDLHTYKTRWQGIYFDPMTPNLGSRVEKPYTDFTKTHRKFGILAYYQVKFYDLIAKINQRLK